LQRQWSLRWAMICSRTGMGSLFARVVVWIARRYIPIAIGRHALCVSEPGQKSSGKGSYKSMPGPHGLQNRRRRKENSTCLWVEMGARYRRARLRISARISKPRRATFGPADREVLRYERSHAGRDRGQCGSDVSHSFAERCVSHNTRIAGKIKTLTGRTRRPAVRRFRTFGQCVDAGPQIART